MHSTAYAIKLYAPFSRKLLIGAMKIFKRKHLYMSHRMLDYYIPRNLINYPKSDVIIFTQ